MNILRRDFLRYCVGSAAALGLEFSQLGSLEKALAAPGDSLIVPVTYQIPASYIASPYTTLDGTVGPILPPPLPAGVLLLPSQLSLYPTYGYGEWEQDGQGFPNGPRFGYHAPDMATGVVSTSSVTDPSKAVPLLSFFTMSDMHICDKESPARCIGYSYNYPLLTTGANGTPANFPIGNSSAYSGIMLYTTHVLDAAVQTINALHRVAPFDFGISLGDAADNTQYNELRWYINVLDGVAIIPCSGSLKGVTSIDYQKPFQPAGLDKSIRWYQEIGNHDQFWMGATQVTDQIRRDLIGSTVLHLGLLCNLPPTPAEWQEVFAATSNYYYMGVIDGSTQSGDVIKTGPEANFTTPPTVTPDSNRRSLSVAEWMQEFFNTTSQPVGHGFTPKMADSGFACYSFLPVPGIPVKVIVLDDTDKVGCGAYGSLDQTRFQWLLDELSAGQNADELMIICAHIPINPYASAPMGDDPGSEPAYYQIWPYSDSGSIVSQQTVLDALHSYQNFVLWIAGHVHRNTITPQPVFSGSQYGFWVAETPSLRDFPQQFRCLQIGINADNNISIFTYSVDTAANPALLGDGLNSPAYLSRSYAVGASQIYHPTALMENPPGKVQQGPGMDPASGVYNAELVIEASQLSPGLQEKLKNLAPVVGTFKLYSTGGHSVTLNNSVLGSLPVSYMASESASFRGAAWKTYSSSPSFTLSAGSGKKTVYLKVQNGAGKVSEIVSAGITV